MNLMKLVSMTSKMDRWIGRIALVTGGSNEIGAAISTELLKHGLTVIGCGDDVEKIRTKPPSVAKDYPGKFHTIKCDLMQESEISSMFEGLITKFGHIDICINNTGFNTDSPMLAAPNNAWRSMLAVNVSAFVVCITESVKIMTKKGLDEGIIINIDSVGGRGHQRHPVTSRFNYYHGTKSWVQYLTQSMRREVRAQNNNIHIWSIGTKDVETTFLPGCLDPGTTSAICRSLQYLEPDDVAQEIVRMLQQPPHVDVDDVFLRPATREI